MQLYKQVVQSMDVKKQKRAAGQVLDKRMIDMWATACFENPEYNER